MARNAWMIRVSLLIVLALTAGQGCPRPSSGRNDGDAQPTVNMRGQRFSPASITIQAGETVYWNNNDFFDHDVMSGDPGASDEGLLFDSGVLPPGGSFSHTFDQPGTYRYFCDLHQDTMTGATVIVE